MILILPLTVSDVRKAGEQGDTVFNKKAGFFSWTPLKVHASSESREHPAADSLDASGRSIRIARPRRL
jgi:hypothetical protein